MLLACSSKEAPSRILCRGLSVCRSSSRKQNRPRCIVQGAAKRNNDSSQKRAFSFGALFLQNVQTLADWNHPGSLSAHPCKFLRSNNWDLNTWGWSYRKWRQREPYTVCRSGRSGSGGADVPEKKSHAGGSRVTLVGSVVGFYLLLESSKSSREGSSGSSRRTARM